MKRNEEERKEGKERKSHSVETNARKRKDGMAGF